MATKLTTRQYGPNGNSNSVKGAPLTFSDLDTNILYLQNMPSMSAGYFPIPNGVERVVDAGGGMTITYAIGATVSESIMSQSGAVVHVAGNLQAVSITASLFGSASYSLASLSASYAVNATTASYANFATSASYSSNATTASYSNRSSQADTSYTASYVQTAQTASRVSGSNVIGTVASSFTASYVQTAQTASYVAGANVYGGVASAFTASYVVTALTASYVAGANVKGDIVGNAATSTTASYALVAPYSGLTGTVPTWNQNTTGTASYATTAQTVLTNANLSGDVSSVGNVTTIGNSKVTNVMLAGAIANDKLTNSSVTVAAGTGMSGGGAVSLGGTVTLTNAGVTSAVAGTNIGVSSATGAVTISVSDSPTFSGNATAAGFFQSSKRELKTNINKFEKNALDIINNTEVVEFNYKNDLDTLHIGIIADNSPEEIATKNKDKFDTNSTVAILLKAVQELSAEVKELKEQLANK